MENEKYPLFTEKAKLQLSDINMLYDKQLIKYMLKQVNRKYASISDERINFSIETDEDKGYAYLTFNVSDNGNSVCTPTKDEMKIMANTFFYWAKRELSISDEKFWDDKYVDKDFFDDLRKDMPANIVVHTPTPFHADDLMCDVMFKTIRKKYHPERDAYTSAIFCGRNPHEINEYKKREEVYESVLMCDIGEGPFDHHQKDCGMYRGIDGKTHKHSAASKFYNTFYADKIDETPNLAQTIDAIADIDNGFIVQNEELKAGLITKEDLNIRKGEVYHNTAVEFALKMNLTLGESLRCAKSGSDLLEVQKATFKEASSLLLGLTEISGYDLKYASIEDFMNNHQSINGQAIFDAYNKRVEIINEEKLHRDEIIENLCFSNYNKDKMPNVVYLDACPPDLTVLTNTNTKFVLFETSSKEQMMAFTVPSDETDEFSKKVAIPSDLFTGVDLPKECEFVHPLKFCAAVLYKDENGKIVADKQTAIDILSARLEYVIEKTEIFHSNEEKEI